jgi:outer membrane protein assembly factor BamB
LQIFNWQNAPYLAAFNASGVVFYNLTDGKELWRHGWKTSYDVNAAMPIISGDKVFISSGYNTGGAMLQSSKKDALLWQNKNMRNHFNTSVWIDGHLYGFDESELACLDAATGRKVWSQGRLGKGSLIAADGKLIILSERGELVIAEASPNGFKELSRSQILGGKCWTAPTLAGGRIYARNASGDLVCVKF